MCNTILFVVAPMLALNNHGVLSTRSVSLLRQVDRAFDHLDANKDGLISRAEWHNAHVGH